MTILDETPTDDTYSNPPLAEEYDSGHGSLEALQDIDDFKKDVDDFKKDIEDLNKDKYCNTDDEEHVDQGLNYTIIEESYNTDLKNMDGQEELKDGNGMDICVPIPENEPMDYLYTPQRLPYNDLVSVLERTVSISSRMDLNRINPTDALIRSTTFSIRPELMSTESLARPRPMGLLRRALTLSHASSLAQAGGEHHMGSLADVYHSIQSLRNVKKIEHPSQELPSKREIIKNYTIACIGHFLIMLGFLPLRSMQTSLNHRDNLGTVGVSAQFGCYVAGALLTPIVLPKLGIKRTLCITMALPSLYILGNVYASFWSLVPSSMIVGVGMAVLYSTQAIYQTGMAYAYSVLHDEPINQVLPLFVATYLTVIQSAGVLGNLLTSSILKFVPPLFASVMNESSHSLVSNISYETQCGAGFCHEYLNSDPASNDIHKPTLYILLAVLGTSILLGALVASCGMDSSLDRLFVKPAQETECCGGQQWKAWLELHKDIRMVLILVLASFTAFMPNFIFSDAMKAYVTCPLGMTMLGYVTVCYGLSNAITTALTGPLARRLGWTNILYLGFSITLVILVIQLFWYPVPSDIWFIFAMFALCGAVDPLFISPCYGIIGVMFSDRSEHAFSLLTVYQALVGAAAFGLSPFTCMTTKLYLMLVYLIITIICYTALEFIVRKEKNAQMTEVDLDFRSSDFKSSDFNKSTEADLDNKV